MPRHIVKGDTVIVTAGSAKGSVGEVIRVLPDEDRVVVSGVNVRNKRIHVRSRTSGARSVPKPIHISNVSPVVDGKPSRVRFESRDDGSKVRLAARDGSVLHELKKARD